MDSTTCYVQEIHKTLDAGSDPQIEQNIMQSNPSSLPCTSEISGRFTEDTSAFGLTVHNVSPLVANHSTAIVGLSLGKPRSCWQSGSKTLHAMYELLHTSEVSHGECDLTADF